MALCAKDGQGVAPSWNQFRITNLENAIEQEPNEAREKATLMKAPGAANGYLSSAEDVDYFKFPMKKNQTLRNRSLCTSYSFGS